MSDDRAWMRDITAGESWDFLRELRLHPAPVDRRLKAHPAVIRLLREHCMATAGAAPPEGLDAFMYGIPVEEDETMVWGSWKLMRDGEVESAGSVVRWCPCSHLDGEFTPAYHPWCPVHGAGDRP